MIAPQLTTDRLVLRGLSMTDWEPYAVMWADDRVTRFTGGTPRPRDLAWTKFTQATGLWPLLGYGFWAVAARDGGAFLGVAGFAQFERNIPELGGFPENGWAFTADSWGRGIATEAVAATVAWADTTLNTETRCMIDHDNRASATVAARNGYLPFADVGDTAGQCHIFRRRSPADASRASS